MYHHLASWVDGGMPGLPKYGAAGGGPGIVAFTFKFEWELRNLVPGSRGVFEGRNGAREHKEVRMICEASAGSSPACSIEHTEAKAENGLAADAAATDDNIVEARL